MKQYAVVDIATNNVVGTFGSGVIEHQTQENYSKGQKVVPQNEVCGLKYYYRAVKPGISGQTQPVWIKRTGEIIVDGSVHWECLEYIPRQGTYLACCNEAQYSKIATLRHPQNGDSSFKFTGGDIQGCPDLRPVITIDLESPQIDINVSFDLLFSSDSELSNVILDFRTPHGTRKIRIDLVPGINTITKAFAVPGKYEFYGNSNYLLCGSLAFDVIEPF